ncbi:MAG: 50S ribosomal protein L18 [Candidatus Gracilibacteria bacterium]|nr:50S ribosomal protein L18 [Candidatus Gracilibacteria bacterium]
MKPKKVLNRERRKARIRSRVTGTPDQPRLVVFRSNLNISAQLIDDTTGKTIASANDIKESKGSKTEKAQNVGKQLAESALSAKISSCVFDRNGYKYHGRIKALADAAREAGLKF